MNKKLLALAVAGVFAAPVAALVQSSVTIGGQLKGGFENLKYNNYSAARPAGSNSSQSGVVDDSSALVFTVTEDLGNGLKAEGRLDNRISLESGGGNNLPGVTAFGATGNTHLGLVSKQWGTLFFGRQDLHYFNTESTLATKGSLRASSISLLSFIGAQPIANASRTNNVVFYKTPDFGPFWMIVAYSANPFAPSADIGSPNRRGRAWNLNPNFSGRNWQVGYSYWNAKQDGAAAANTSAGGDQRSDRLYGHYEWSGFSIGLAWDRSKITGPLAGGTVLNNRTTWSIPMSYTWGNNTVFAHFDRAGADKAAAFAGMDTKATMLAVSYAYDLSKRTSVAVTYAQINNGAAANYNFFTSGALGLGNTGPLAGEKPRMWGLTMRHAY